MKCAILFSVVLFIAVAFADEHKDYFAPANYKFEYGVSDPHSGDKKSQQETRHGDVVKGSYSLHEADGTVRVVEYTSDPHTGFNAVVKRVGHAKHPQYHDKKGHATYPGGESYIGTTHYGGGKHQIVHGKH